MLAIAASIFGMAFEPARYSVALDNVRIGEVVRGPMLIRVSGTGHLRPREIHWVDTRTAGRVETVAVRPGDPVDVGDVLAVLKNPTVDQQAEEAALLLDAALANDEAFKSGLESELLNQKARLLRAKVAYESAKLELEANDELNRRGEGLVPDIDVRRTRLDVNQKQEIWLIEKELLENFRANVSAQLRARTSTTDQLRRALARAEERHRSLKVRATMRGVVQDVPVEVGQQLIIGTTVTKIASTSDLFVELQISAMQAGEVARGQRVEIDTRKNLIEGIVERLDPNVTKGKVLVDVGLVADLPTSARPDLEVTGTIEVARIDDTLHIERPVQNSSSEILPVYLLNQSASAAHRVDITTGKSSVDRVQVLSGLQEGDRIILSDSSAWYNQDQIQLD